MVVILVLVGSPPYGVLRVLVHDNVLVLRGTSGVDTGHYIDGTEFGHLTFLVTLESRFGLFIVENLVRWVVKNFLDVLYTIFAQIHLWHNTEFVLYV